MLPDRPLRIGYNGDFAPFAFEDAGQARGLAIDTTRSALGGAGLDADFTPFGLSKMFDALLDGAIDMLAGTGAAAARAEQFAFSRPLVATGGAWFPRAAVAWPSDADLNAGVGQGLRVVTPAAGPLAAHIGQTFPQLDLATCDDYAAALDQVTTGAADAAALNFHVGCAMVEGDARVTTPAGAFIQVNLALAVLAGDPAGLLALLNPHIPPVAAGT